jgi:acetoin utilization deacetylase AcuC-like enzyme
MTFAVAVVVAILGLSSSTVTSTALLDTFGSGTSLPILFDSSNHLHRALTYHPEQPARVEACVKALQEYQQQRDSSNASTLQFIDVATQRPSSGEPWWSTSIHQPVSAEELDRARNVLLKIHAPEVVTNLETRCQKSRQSRIDEGKPSLGFVGYVDDDTYVTTETYDVCLRATATWMRAIDWLHLYQTEQGSKLKQAAFIPTAMALTRPPGHHATQAMSNGFCLFNFAAAAARHYQQQANKDNNIVKVSILDWDVHYGQGVADIVSKYPETIRYASIHQSPAFPYLGQKRQVQGNILTIPMPADTTWTCGYESLLEYALDFLFASDHTPDLVIVCAGYDALDSDELASVNLNAEDYGRMTRALLGKIRMQQAAAATTNNNKPVALLLGLEGGYQLGEMAGGGNLQQAVVETVHALLEQAY